jgi:chromosome segregation ATPase
MKRLHAYASDEDGEIDAHVREDADGDLVSYDEAQASVDHLKTERDGLADRMSVLDQERDALYARLAQLEADLRAAIDERDRALASLARMTMERDDARDLDQRNKAAAYEAHEDAAAELAAERQVSDSRQQRIAELEGLASLAACAIDVRLTANPAWHNLADLDEALATVSREAKALLGADPHVDARDQPELMRRSEVKA